MSRELERDCLDREECYAPLLVWAAVLVSGRALESEPVRDRADGSRGVFYCMRQSNWIWR
jgi:hypothetical protein